MKIVLAPDSYKGSLTAKQACDAMEKGIQKAYPTAEVIKVPMADGGEGTVQSLVDARKGSIHTCQVANPIGEIVEASYGILGDGVTAVMEMAEASGLYLIREEQRNPLKTSTYGTGEVILAALQRGCRSFIVGIGGSATNDGGVGMAQALGVKFLDENGHELPAGSGGGSLGDIHQIDISGLDDRIKESSFTVACDVDNPLTGPSGATYVFGPQKGATPSMMEQLDSNLAHYATVIERDLKQSVVNLAGAGAAGGLGAGLVAFLGATLKRGVEIVIDTVRLEEHIRDADLIFSGEGRCDSQTVHGKTPYGVAKLAQKWNVPVILIAGSIGPGVEVLYKHGVESVFSMVDGPMSVEEAMKNANSLLERAAERIIRTKKFSS